ncbi:hypothetical protein [Fundidesulfovibrio terrae]|uniref:hypothetical protein n=1 Tax=Fundidesulfovibrio terrae TaxID=2922866 RepID=UPI001FAF5B68|nr:hypothetical protein [Fundidesulfovibrio terrae]
MVNRTSPPPWGLPCVLAAVTLLYLLAYGPVLWAPGHIYQNWDQTFPAFASQVRAYGSISASTWNGNYEMGSPGPMTGMTFYLDLLVRQGLAGLGGGILARWLGLAYALAGAAGFWTLSRRMGLSGLCAFVVCAVSQFNPKTYSLALSGHTEAGFAYALTPWAVCLADMAVTAASRHRMLAAALGLGMVLALACSSPFGVTSAGVILAVYCAAAAIRRPKRAASVFALAASAALVLHLHWILPTALGATGSDSFKYNLNAEDIQAEYTHKYREYSVPPRQAMIGHTDNLGMGTEYAYPVAPPLDAWWKPSAYALLALALLGLLGRTASPALKWFAALSLVLGFVLLTGSKTLPGAYLYEVILARVKMVFFLMARPTRWLYIYYAGLALLVGLGLEAVRRRTFWTAHRWPDRVAAALAAAVLAVYLQPWWSGQLAVPKNETTQTMSLTPQPLRTEERELVEALDRDPGLYRVSVFPTISSPTGNIPAPPASSLTRNFGMLGKDSLVGPAFVGNPYGRYMLSLAHRRAASTDEYGRLLGLGAVRRVVWDKDEPYLSYLDYGWMPATKRGSETLPDPRDVLRPFLTAQRDLVPDPGWSRGPFTVLDNKDFLPRIRAVRTATLAAGGLPLLASMAQLPDNPFASQALFFATDLDATGIQRLGATLRGLAVHNDAWPEFALPFLPASYWLPARPRGAAPAGWSGVADRWHHALWLEGSPLNAGAMISQAASAMEIPLPGAGPHRLLARVASMPAQHGLAISLAGRELAQTPSGDPFDRGWRWLDLGVQNLDGSPLVLSARGRGAVVSGVLAVPEATFRAALESALRAVGQPGPPNAPSSPSPHTSVTAEAEFCVEKSPGVYSPVRDIALLAKVPGLAMQTSGLREDGLEGSGAGTLAAEGDLPGQATFKMDFPYPVSGFTLVSYPRLFGDPGGKAYARASWSANGKTFQPLYELAGATDGKWEDVYARREEVSARRRLSSVWIRFDLRQAQLTSLANPPNQPMTVSVAPDEPFPGAPSMGQAAMLPARFALHAFGPGPQLARARLLTPQGPVWKDLGTFEPDASGLVRLDVDASSGAACDVLELRSLPDAAAPPAPDAPDSERLSSARYQVKGTLPAGGLLLFSEAYHPSWEALPDSGPAIKPLKAYGFMNAYPLPQDAPDSLRLAFSPEKYRDLGLSISTAGWIVFALAVAALLCWPGRSRS